MGLHNKSGQQNCIVLIGCYSIFRSFPTLFRGLPGGLPDRVVVFRGRGVPGGVPGVLGGVPGGVPGGFRVGSGWIPGGFRLGSVWIPGGFRVGSGWVPAFTDTRLQVYCMFH